MLSKYGYIRVACVVPALKVADPGFNLTVIEKAVRDLSSQGVSLAVFPELCITGYSCADLFYQETLLRGAMEALVELTDFTNGLNTTLVLGVPVLIDGRLYNCAALLNGGKILGMVPKTFLPNTNEYYEHRWFASGRHLSRKEIILSEQIVPVGTDLLFYAADLPECVIGVEICEDLWSVKPPSADQALAGATIIVNPSASNELLGKASYRKGLVKQQSARCMAAYAYSSAGPCESSTDVVFSGHALVAENGELLAESERFNFSTSNIIADVDAKRLVHERLRNSSFLFETSSIIFRRINFSVGKYCPHDSGSMKLLRPIKPLQFVPANTEDRSDACKEIFSIQSHGLAKRLLHLGTSRVVIGVSGGLDSTLAVLVAARAFDILGLDREGIFCVTMPGFGTSQRTRNNAEKLPLLVGATVKTIPISNAVSQHFSDIEHSNDVIDIVYENSQARERTQILMDFANKVGAFVVGTGDLSESALGWCTYNGDHMSMYHVNIGVPKTLVRYLIEWCADEVFDGEASNILRDICATPITPELLPLSDGKNSSQETESIIGPYELHDFFLWYVVRCQFEPDKILFLAQQAFGQKYTSTELKSWLRVFYERFFSQQFKRSCMPDGPKVGSVALSPRGDWRMPSDASVAMWLKALD
jgi:NAD+ synthase (glutamine-hydrolysing)